MLVLQGYLENNDPEQLFMSGPEFDISLESPEVAVALHQADILPLGVQLDLTWKEQVSYISKFSSLIYLGKRVNKPKSRRI